MMNGMKSTWFHKNLILQVHTPLEEQDVEDDPELLHPQAEKFNVINETIIHRLG